MAGVITGGGSRQVGEDASSDVLGTCSSGELGQSMLQALPASCSKPVGWQSSPR